MVLKPLGRNTEGKDDWISFIFMFCCWVNSWGCIHHNFKIVFTSYFGLKFSLIPGASRKAWIVWFLSYVFLWIGQIPGDSFFKLLLIFWIFLFLGHFWAPYTKKLIQNLPGTPHKAWVVQFLSTVLNSRQKSSSKIQLKRCPDFILFFWKLKSKIEFDQNIEWFAFNSK